jgi:two-component system cell cycle sensor histidine kinase/response regulator CckA
LPMTETLFEKADFLRSLFDAIPSFLFIVDSDVRIFHLNAAAETLLNAERKDVLMKRGGEAMHCIYSNEVPGGCGRSAHCADCVVRNSVGKAFGGTGVFRETANVKLQADGEVRDIYLMVTASPFQYEGVRFALLVLEEFKELKKAEEEKRKLEEQLRQSQKMEAVGQLAGGIAHDFNNRLSAIINYGHLLKLKIGEDDPMRRYVENILSVAERAAGLTHGLLTFSRKGPLQLRPVNVNEVVRGVLQFYSRVLPENIRVQASLAGEDLIIMADRGLIENVLINLAINARDAMAGGGALTITVEAVTIDDFFVRANGYGEPGRYALLSVADTGVGMDRATVERVFEPFFTTKQAGKGTGLGLSTAYGVVKQHGGYIRVYSEPGRGTSFRIYLPLAGPDAAPTEPEEAPPQGGTETVLLAEDDDSVRNGIRQILEEFGYTVIEASDGGQAISKFSEAPDSVRLLILDMLMPEMSGTEVYEMARRKSPGIKAVFMSGYTNAMRGDRFSAGDAAVVSKPASPLELLKKMRRLLDG